MAIAMVQHWPEGGNNTENYDAINERIGAHDNMPDGLIVHTAGTTDGGGFRIFDVWETHEQMERFVRERLMPAVQHVAGPDAAPPSTEVYELHSLLRA